jgi:hypothetical protein
VIGIRPGEIGIFQWEFQDPKMEEFAKPWVSILKWIFMGYTDGYTDTPSSYLT